MSEREINWNYRNERSPTARYCTEMSTKLAKCQIKLMEASGARKDGYYHSGSQVLSMVMGYIRLTGAKRVLDIGTYTGASALAAALAIPEDGKVISMDVNHEMYLSIGEPIVKEEGVAHKIEFVTAPAKETLNRLIADGECGKFDFALVDTCEHDRVNYPTYYNLCKKLLRKGGVLMMDDVLWFGSVVDPDFTTPDVVAIRKTNQMARDDDEVDSMVLDVDNGLLVVFIRP